MRNFNLIVYSKRSICYSHASRKVASIQRRKTKIKTREEIIKCGSRPFRIYLKLPQLTHQQASIIIDYNDFLGIKFYLLSCIPFVDTKVVNFSKPTIPQLNINLLPSKHGKSPTWTHPKK